MIVTYNSIINLFSKLQDNKKAEHYLNELIQKYDAIGDEALRPNTVSFNACLSSFSRAKTQEEAQRCETIFHQMQERACSEDNDLRPDAFTMTNIIAAWGNSNNPERAEALLNKMQTLYEQGDDEMKPTTVSFGSVLHAWSRRGDVSRAEAIVAHMEKLMNVEGNEEMRPNTVIYNTLINCHAKSRKPDAAQKAEIIFAKMKQFKRDGILSSSPSIITYNTILSALHSDSRNNYTKAKDILREMEEESTIDPSIRPETITFTTFLKILAGANEPKKSLIAEGIINRMEENLDDLKLRPNNLTYDAVLKVCKFPVSKSNKVRRHAFVLAIKTLSMMQKLPHIKATSFTYAEFFSVIGRLKSNDEEYCKLVEKSFESCCEAGVLNDRILGILINTTPQNLLKKLFRTEHVVKSVSMLPPNWSYNSKYGISNESERVQERSIHNTGRSRIKR